MFAQACYLLIQEGWHFAFHIEVPSGFAAAIAVAVAIAVPVAIPVAVA